MLVKDWYWKRRAEIELSTADRKASAGEPEAAILALARAVRFAEQEPALRRRARWQAAELLAELGRFADSASQLEALIAMGGAAGPLWRTLALRREKAGQADEAIKAWRGRLALDPADPESHERLAALLLVAGRRLEAALHVRWLADAAPGDQAAWTRLAELLTEVGDRDGAVLAWEHMAGVSPTAREHAISLLDQLGRTAEATAHIRASAQAAPADTPAWKRLARRLQATGECEGALEAWSHIAADDRGAHESLAQLLIELGRPSDATTHIRALAELAPTKAKAWRRLAQHLEATGEEDAAVSSWRKVLALAPADPLVLAHLYTRLEGLRPKGLAIEHYRSLIETRPEDLELRKALARTLQDEGDGDGAVEAWRAVSALAPANLEAREQLGILLVGLKRRTEAIPHLRAHAEAQPGRSKLWRRLANALQDSGDSDAALEAWDRLLALEPHDPEAHERAATLRRALGRTRELVLHLRALGEASPMRSDLWRELGRILDEQDESTGERISVWRRLLDAAPLDLEAHGRLATLVWDAGDRIGAILHLETVTQAWPEQIKPWNRLALSRQGARDVKGEIDALARVVELDRSDRSACWRLARLLWERGCTREAIPYLRAVASDGGRTMKELKRLGRSLAAGGDSEVEEAASLDRLGEVHEEIAVWKRVLATDPADREANDRLAELFWKMDRKREAAPHLLVVVKAAPRHAKLWRRLAMALEDCGRLDEATGAWRSLAELEGPGGPASVRAAQLAARLEAPGPPTAIEVEVAEEF